MIWILAPKHPTNTKLEILAAYFTCLKILKNVSMQQANPSMKSHKYEQEELKVYWKKHKIWGSSIWDCFIS